MIEDIEELRAELDVEGLRDIRVLKNREVNRGERRTMEFVTPRITEHIRAELRAAGGGNWGVRIRVRCATKRVSGRRYR